MYRCSDSDVILKFIEKFVANFEISWISTGRKDEQKLPLTLHRSPTVPNPENIFTSHGTAEKIRREACKKSRSLAVQFSPLPRHIEWQTSMKVNCVHQIVKYAHAWQSPPQHFLEHKLERISSGFARCLAALNDGDIESSSAKCTINRSKHYLIYHLKLWAWVSSAKSTRRSEQIYCKRPSLLN